MAVELWSIIFIYSHRIGLISLTPHQPLMIRRNCHCICPCLIISKESLKLLISIILIAIGKNTDFVFLHFLVFSHSSNSYPFPICSDINSRNYWIPERIRLGGNEGTTIVKENYQLRLAPNDQHFRMVRGIKLISEEGNRLAECVGEGTH